MRDLVDGGAGEGLLELHQCVRVMPVSSAEAERMLSQMNLVASDLRASLLVTSIANVMMIRINGPPLAQWDPKPFVKVWKLSGHRAASDTRTRRVRGKDLDLNKKPMWDAINK